MFLPRDWKRRTLYFAGLVNNRPHLVQSYLSKSAAKTLLRMIKYVGRQGIPGNILREQFLKSFPSTEAKKTTFPKLIIIGFKVHQRGCQRSSIAWTSYALQYSNIPPTCQAFRECVVKSIPCFKYHDTIDGTSLTTSILGRDENQEYHCICTETFWSKYAVCIKDGPTCVQTTDVTCLKNINVTRKQC